MQNARHRTRRRSGLDMFRRTRSGKTATRVCSQTPGGTSSDGTGWHRADIAGPVATPSLLSILFSALSTLRAGSGPVTSLEQSPTRNSGSPLSPHEIRTIHASSVNAPATLGDETLASEFRARLSNPVRRLPTPHSTMFCNVEA